LSNTQVSWFLLSKIFFFESIAVLALGAMIWAWINSCSTRTHLSLVFLFVDLVFCDHFVWFWKKKLVFSKNHIFDLPWKKFSHFFGGEYQEIKLLNSSRIGPWGLD